MIGQIFGAGLQFASNATMSSWNNARAANREAQARAENYKYGEMAANNADIRTRQLYNSLYSPEAQLKQLKSAGLSPSLFYGDGGGISGQTGAQGTGAVGVNPNTYGISPIDMSQIRLQDAQADNVRADTEKKRKETEGVELNNVRKDLENEIMSFENGKYKNAYYLSSAVFSKGDGDISTSEIAQSCNSYEDFLKEMRKACEKSGDKNMKDYLNTEYGQQELRSIFEMNKKLGTQIAELSNQKTNAEFLEAVTNALNKHGYTEQNAKTTLQKLKSEEVTNSLTEKDKAYWNDIMDKLDKEDNFTKWVAMCLAAIFGRTNFSVH